MSGVQFKRSDETIFSPVGADILALHIPNGRCYGMEEVSAAVWNLLDRPRDLDGICEELMRDYDVDPAVCRSDVEQLLEVLRAEGLIDAARDGN